MQKIFLVAFFLLIFQGVLTYFQIKNYHRRVVELQKKGTVGIGNVKGSLKAGNIIILACNDDGKILDGEMMEGITVFNRFRKIENIKGMHIGELKEKYIDQKPTNQSKAMLQALATMEENLSKKFYI